MRTLRARLTALFIGAILAVVGFATWIFAFILDYPHTNPLLEQMRLILTIANKSGSLRPPGPGEQEIGKQIGFRSVPVSGRVLEGPTGQLREMLRHNGVFYDAAVMELEPDGEPVISLKISDSEWLVLPGTRSSGAVWPAAAGWLLLVAAGAAGMAAAAVYWTTRPLALIQRTVAGIGPSGEVPKLAETGPPEVRAVSHAINSLSSQLKGAMESRMRLVAAAGHDLRTPITRMRLRAEFLEDKAREKWIADLEELDRIADSAIQLVHEETARAGGADVRLDDIVGDAVAELRELQFDARFEHLQPARVHARPLSLKRALRNLIINAATHGRGAVVSVGIEGANAVVSIEDCGPGIPEALLQRVCEPFFRVEQPQRSSVPGAGLGMAIAKEIVERNMGQLELANRPGGGLLQRVRLPLVTPPR